MAAKKTAIYRRKNSGSIWLPGRSDINEYVNKQRILVHILGPRSKTELVTIQPTLRLLGTTSRIIPQTRISLIRHLKTLKKHDTTRVRAY